MIAAARKSALFEEYVLALLFDVHRQRELITAYVFFFPLDAFGLQGHIPMYVNATAGTTVYGAFDPINEIADICEKYNMWLHVDVRIKSSSVQIIK